MPGYVCHVKVFGRSYEEHGYQTSCLICNSVSSGVEGVEEGRDSAQNMAQRQLCRNSNKISMNSESCRKTRRQFH